MTVLIGSNTPTSGGNLGPGSGQAISRGSQAALASGVVANLNAYLNSLGTGATTLYMALTDASFNVLCQGSVAAAVGLNTIPIAGGPSLVATTQYWLWLQVNGTTSSGYVTDGSGGFHVQHLSNTTLPFTNPFGSGNTNTAGGILSAWADDGGGGGGGGGAIPLGMLLGVGT